MADRVEADRPSDRFEVYGVHAWRTFCLFLAVQTQWRTEAISGLKGGRILYLGLDYNAVDRAARWARIRVAPERFADLQDMETAALGILNEHR